MKSPDLEELIARILELVPTEKYSAAVFDAVWNLTCDLRTIAGEKGENIATMMATTLENGVRAYLEYERVLRTMMPGQRMKRAPGN